MVEKEFLLLVDISLVEGFIGIIVRANLLQSHRLKFSYNTMGFHKTRKDIKRKERQEKTKKKKVDLAQFQRLQQISVLDQLLKERSVISNYKNWQFKWQH